MAERGLVCSHAGSKEQAPVAWHGTAGELITFASKAELLAQAERYWNPDKTRFWSGSGVPLVIGRREGYVIHDVTGKPLIDMHLNGGTYNLGHRNPEIIAAVTEAMGYFDVGNHHFPSIARTALAKALVETAPEGISKVMFDRAAQDRVDRQGLPRPHRAGRRHRRRAIRPALPRRPAR
jgi:4-aminobutyrate aminotransferase-like enzyme